MNLELKDISTVRIYYHHGATIKGQSFWRRMMSSSLGHALLRKAKDMQIAQAVIFSARSGYLRHDDIRHHLSEMPHHKHPVCLELMDTAENLQRYLVENKDMLTDVDVVLMNESNFRLHNSD